MHLPALIEGQSEWPAHGQRHCNSVAIHYLLCRFGSFASRRWTPKRSRHDPLQFIKQKLASRSAKAVAFSEALASIFRQASQRIPNVLHSSCFKIMKKTQNITTYDKICILLYCVYPVRNAKIATTLNSVNVRVCVCTIWIDVKLLIIAGACGTHVLPHAMKAWAWVGRETWPVSCTCNYIYSICRVPPLGAFKSQLGGTYILSLLVYNFVSCDYSSICVYQSCHLIVGVFARLMHSAAKFATTVLIKCVCVCHFFHTDSIIIASYESCYRWWPHVSSTTGL